MSCKRLATESILLLLDTSSNSRSPITVLVENLLSRMIQSSYKSMDTPAFSPRVNGNIVAVALHHPLTKLGSTRSNEVLASRNSNAVKAIMVTLSLGLLRHSRK